MPGVAIDGNDVIAVCQASKELIDRAREGKGPAFLECRTYRWHGHFESPMPEIRPLEEVEEWKKRDPVKAAKTKLLAGNILTEQQLREIDSQIMTRIDDAVRYAVDSPFPAPEDSMEDVYSD